MKATPQSAASETTRAMIYCATILVLTAVSKLERIVMRAAAARQRKDVALRLKELALAVAELLLRSTPPDQRSRARHQPGHIIL